MIQKVIDQIIKETDGLENSVFDVEVENTFVTGCIRRQYQPTWGGSYLGDKEQLSELISSEIEVESIATYDEDGDEIDSPFTALGLQLKFME